MKRANISMVQAWVYCFKRYGYKWTAVSSWSFSRRTAKDWNEAKATLHRSQSLPQVGVDSHRWQMLGFSHLRKTSKGGAVLNFLGFRLHMRSLNSLLLDNRITLGILFGSSWGYKLDNRITRISRWLSQKTFNSWGVDKCLVLGWSQWCPCLTFSWIGHPTFRRGVFFGDGGWWRSTGWSVHPYYGLGFVSLRDTSCWQECTTI